MKGRWRIDDRGWRAKMKEDDGRGNGLERRGSCCIQTGVSHSDIPAHGCAPKNKELLAQQRRRRRALTAGCSVPNWAAAIG
ncbi:hypothetical protein VFPFJ_05087 [Purpureocillium lilacinum]|uniref:Uncharacterized protein n=1 Tax=Purpureocillium lilacinum TaxID=33203 RepID=A0A179H1K7_PURLI|nr:hypothetical protein VFPFJ_05087 [Purpureocillium lilacinum]OAQ84136.1 hypothetical protein VFPBJ_02904 [Purpureocillium lilacinum]OAQ90928.1 hypothetical protein VFPFJ_05087 [Purpureocillium lilacinum]